jgi:hypothetical protein
MYTGLRPYLELPPVPNATIVAESAIAQTAKRNGPLPAYPAATPEGSAWWTGYALAPTDPAGAVAARYLLPHRAGRRRKLVEPGIDPATDPRSQLPPVPRLRF